MVNDFNVLPRRMKNLEHLLVDHQVEERFEVDAGGEAIHQDLGAVRRHLDEAELRPEGLLAHKLGVHRHKRSSAKPRAGLGQVLATGNEMHRLRYSLRNGLRPRAPIETDAPTPHFFARRSGEKGRRWAAANLSRIAQTVPG